MSAFCALLKRDLVLAWRQGGGALNGALFLLGLTLLLPLSLGPDLVFLARTAPALLWIGALLATFLSLDRLFQSDDEDGALDILLLSDLPLEATVLAKICAHWLTHAMPLVLISPIFGLMLGLDMKTLANLIMSLALGTPALTALGALGSALTLNLKRGGLLLPVLVLPLSLPLLLFGSLAAGASDAFFSSQPLALLGCLTLLSLALSPFATAAALKASRS